jgi:hypothetical protein
MVLPASGVWIGSPIRVSIFFVALTVPVTCATARAIWQTFLSCKCDVRFTPKADMDRYSPNVR